MVDRAPSSPSPVLLVSCYELGHAPLGLSVPAGLLRSAGMPVETLDLAIEPLDEALVVNANFIAISTPMHTSLRLGVSAARRMREIRPDVHICFFGMYAELNADHLLGGVADTCLGAEYEVALVELAARLLGTAPRALPSDPDHRMRPDPDAVRHPERYVKLAWRGERHRVAQVVSTKGCRHRCTHCPLPPLYDGRFTAIEVDDIMAGIDGAVERGARHITFSDPDFLNGPGHARRVARALHARHPHLTFDYTAKISHLKQYPDLVEELARMGNLFVVSAVESLDDEVLRHLDKGHTRSDALAVFGRFHDIGLALRPTLVPFTPWETLDGYRDMLDVLAGAGMVPHVDPVQYSIRLLVPPGSLLLASPAMKEHLQTLDAENFTWRWRHPDPRMDTLQREVSAIAARAATTGDDPVTAWAAIRAAADRAAGVAPSGPPATPPVGADDPAPPRLTEPWFC